VTGGLYFIFAEGI